VLNYDTLTKFETMLSEYTGAPYVVLTDSCTHAIELCVRYKKVGYASCASHTYLSVPMVLYKTKTQFQWDNSPWEYQYQLGQTTIWDSARAFDQGMYRNNQLQCLSFGHGKRLEIGHGGAILTNKQHEYTALKQMAYDGRDLSISPWQDQPVFKLGFHYNMRLEDAARGMWLMGNGTLKSKESQLVKYPDCSKLKFDI
jgi:dTDP-4-amino-4,6-dideoxygalactose transaminase